MPFEITHAVLGHAIVKANGGTWGKKIFFGCMFPDIRYLARVERRLTHVEEEVKVGDLKNDFQIGVRLHCQIDRIWDEAVAELHLTNTNPQIPEMYYTSLLKAVQEVVAWKQLAMVPYDFQMEKIVDAIALPPPISTQQFKDWYTGLADYFSEGSTLKGLTTLGQLIQLPQPVIRELLIYFEEMKKDTVTVQKLTMIQDRMSHYLLEE